MFRSLTFLAAAVSALKVHQEGDPMTQYVDAMIQDYRACNDAWVASSYLDGEEYDACVDKADDDFVNACKEDSECAEEAKYTIFDVIQDEDFWDAVFED